MVVTDRVELMKQAGGAFARLGLTPVNIKAGSKPDLTLPLHVAMVETLSKGRRLRTVPCLEIVGNF